MNLKFLKAFAIFVGTIIGVGIFALPYVASKSGFFIVVGYFILMTAVIIFVNLFYGRVVAETNELLYLPGHAEKYLGRKWKIVSLFTIGLGVLGALLAYLIIGGEFLHLLFGGNIILLTLAFFISAIILIFRGTKSMANFELFLLAVFFVILIIFFIKAVPFIDFKNFTSFDSKFLTLPYGVILFALWGATVIPVLKEITGPDPKILKKVIINGTTFSAFIYLIFIFLILGVSGHSTSKEAIAGFINVAGNGILKLGFIFGIVNIFDSFVSLGITLKKILWHDFGISKNKAWLITCFIPLVLFFLGFKEYISIMGLIGAFLIGAEGIIIVFIYRNFLKTKGQKINPLAYSLCGIFALGILFETLYFFTKIA